MTVSKKSVLTMSRALQRVVGSQEIWNAVTKGERVPKPRDLFYRLLIDRVYTGTKLLWTERTRGGLAN